MVIIIIINKEDGETFAGDKYVYSIDCADDFMGICLSPNI